MGQCSLFSRAGLRFFLCPEPLTYTCPVKTQALGEGYRRQLCCEWFRGLQEGAPGKVCSGDDLSGTPILSERLACGSGHIGSCELPHNRDQRCTPETELLY